MIDGATNNTFGDQKQLIQLQKTSSLRKTFGVVGIAANSTEEAKSGNVERSEINNSYSTFNWLDAKLAFIDKEEISEVEDESSLNGNEDVLAWCSGINKLNDQRNTSFESLESNTTTIEQKQQSRQLNDENEISRRFPEELFGEKTPNKIVTASIEKRYEKINERKETRHSGNVNDAKATHLKLERDTETQQNLEHNRKSTKSQENKNTEAKNTPQEDELILCIDMMAAHMKELELEKERVKLDVIVALRRRFDSLLLNNRIMDSGERNEGSGDGGKEVPAQFFEELNDSLYDITLDEVTRIKREEREKQQRIEEGYQLQVQKLSKELESLAQQKCELLVEISNCKEKTRFLEDRQGKHERAENRTVYLESLLRNVENENAKLKTKVEALENEALEIQQQNRTLTSSVKDLKHKLELSTSAEESTTQFYNAEHEKLLDDNKRAKDELFELQNQLESLRQEKQRIVNSKETDISIIKHLEEKLKRQGTLLENVSDDSNKHFETNLKLENKAAEYKQKLKKCAFGIESTQHENKKLQEENASLEREKSDLKKTVGELKQRELEHSFELSMQKADFERKQSSWNSQREHLERKLKLLLASAESNAVAIHNSNNAHNSRIDAQKTVSFKHSLFNSSNDFHTTINTKPQISRNEPFINQSLLSDSTDFHTTTTKPQISRSEPFINQSIFSDSNSIIHNNSNRSFRKNETQNTILHSYNHGLSLGDVVTSSSKNKMVDEAAVQNPYAFDHSITNHSHLANVNGQTTTNYLKKNSSSFPSYGVPSINSHNRDLFSNGNAPNHSKNAHFQNGINKSPPYNEYSTAQLLQKPVNGNERINSSVTSPAKESKTKVKYTADDTRYIVVCKNLRCCRSQTYLSFSGFLIIRGMKSIGFCSQGEKLT